MKWNPAAKGGHAALTRHILGLSRPMIAEFEKAEIVEKTVRLRRNGVPKEDISFPAFNYFKLIKQEWESSDFRSNLLKRFFFVVYQFNGGKEPVLRKTLFWSMPTRDREIEAHSVWKETIRRIRAHRADALPKKSENAVAHVRPHGRDKRDTLPAPGGLYVVKKCFWLNASYIAQQLT